ncbi:CK1 family protein kinase [Trichomonas vaginalis G3]|uniref:non-specific serine/threonine protein kinase n=1 Tax=Trichomonas vaginalis (strain ATCC PRA-98 / G3) TaxID=412133 RepID=A2FQ71_TRIV3|nr:protein kinase protein [Trichomonas vaginalis G3]EAX92943.1 CK1 family protein kinase [Trichomonas vaginalis G3]KAI5553167.1 protein kinase protein [Trichomonas vaginalis G3]|eukprot:XP_001305873.1 CK1 family protein kinase [Trichomonas vaginalis G3]
MEKLKQGAKFGDYRLVQCVGHGAFGSVWSAKKEQEEQAIYAIKFEFPTVSKPILASEALINQDLSNLGTFTKFYESGTLQGLSYMVIEMLGMSVRIFQENHPGGILPLSEVGRLGDAMLTAIHKFHDAGYVHRDIKPSNFVFRGRPADLDVCLIDFGLAKRWRNKDGTIEPERPNVGFRGTSRYASINSHDGADLGRRDDLWSLFYLLIELFAPPLPWKAQTSKDAVAQIKRRGVAKLCVGLPPQFNDFAQHLSTLGFADEPNYEHLHDLLHGITEIGDNEGGGSDYGGSLSAQFGSMSLIVAPNSGSVIGSSSAVLGSWEEGARNDNIEVNDSINEENENHEEKPNKEGSGGCCILI